MILNTIRTLLGTLFNHEESNLRFTNTLSGAKETFTPQKNNTVSVYTCGPTVYQPVHIGNLRAYVFADTLRRTLVFNEYDVQHVINITDVGHLVGDQDLGEDKVEQAARKAGSVSEVVNRYTSLFFNDLDALNIPKGAYKFPKASEYIAEQIALVEALESKGHTYKTSDGIYFDTSTFPEYGKLGNIPLEELKAGARVETHPEKRNIHDFALWKFSAEGEQRLQEWDSPWGMGFPGWHIECSAMSRALLGNEIDIHTGGEDHVSIHHNNEIAQSESVTGTQYVHYWLHNAFLTMGEEKISKSLGNVVYLADLVQEGFHPLALRYVFLEAHYRTHQSFTKDSLQAAQHALKRIYRIYRDELLHHSPTTPDIESVEAFTEAINDDLHTSRALAVLWSTLRNTKLNPGTKRATIDLFDTVLGLNIEYEAGQTPEIPTEIQELAQKREELRNNKEYEAADTIRNEILEKGYEISDTEDGFIVEKI